MSAAAAPAPRDTAFDAFRGLAILMVVFGHSGAYGWAFQHEPGGEANFWFALLLRNFALTSLPVFLFASGYFLATSRVQSQADYALFLQRRFSRVAIPYLVWSLLFAALSWLRAEPGSFHGRIESIPFKLLTGTADGSFFFILLMMQFYLLVPLMLWLCATPARMAATVGAHAAYVGLLYGLRFYWWPDMPYEVVKTPFLAWLCLFPLGMYARRVPQRMTAIPLYIVFSLSVLFFTIANIETALLLPFSFEFAISDIRFPTLLMGAAAIGVLLHTRAWPWPAWLGQLGVYSFGIFFIHGIIVRFFAKLMLLVPGLFELYPLYTAAVALPSLALSVSIIYVARRVLGPDRASRFLGF